MDKKRVWLRLTAAEHKEFKAAAALRGMTMEQAGAEAVREWVERHLDAKRKEGQE